MHIESMTVDVVNVSLVTADGASVNMNSYDVLAWDIWGANEWGVEVHELSEGNFVVQYQEQAYEGGAYDYQSRYDVYDTEGTLLNSIKPDLSHDNMIAQGYVYQFWDLGNSRAIDHDALYVHEDGGFTVASVAPYVLEDDVTGERQPEVVFDIARYDTDEALVGEPTSLIWNEVFLKTPIDSSGLSSAYVFPLDLGIQKDSSTIFRDGGRYDASSEEQVYTYSIVSGNGEVAEYGTYAYDLVDHGYIYTPEFVADMSDTADSPVAETSAMLLSGPPVEDIPIDPSDELEADLELLDFL